MGGKPHPDTGDTWALPGVRHLHGAMHQTPSHPLQASVATPPFLISLSTMLFILIYVTVSHNFPFIDYFHEVQCLQASLMICILDSSNKWLQTTILLQLCCDFLQPSSLHHDWTESGWSNAVSFSLPRRLELLVSSAFKCFPVSLGFPEEPDASGSSSCLKTVESRCSCMWMLSAAFIKPSHKIHLSSSCLMTFEQCLYLCRHYTVASMSHRLELRPQTWLNTCSSRGRTDN